MNLSSAGTTVSYGKALYRGDPTQLVPAANMQHLVMHQEVASEDYARVEEKLREGLASCVGNEGPTVIIGRHIFQILQA